MSKIKQIIKILANRKNDFVISQKQGYISNIVFNRPTKGNSITLDMWLTLTKLITQANQDQTTKFIVIKGQGKNFCTGYDLESLKDPELEKFTNQELIEVRSKHIIYDYAKAIIQSQKPIFGLVQGRVTGVAFTQLALYEKIFATENSLFRAPFIKVCMGPELCSSYTFPKIFGKHVANDILVGGKQYKAKDLQKYGFIEVSQDYQSAKQKLKQHLEELNELEWQSYLDCKKLIKSYQLPHLLNANKLEFQNLQRRWRQMDKNNYYISKYLNQEKAKRLK